MRITATLLLVFLICTGCFRDGQPRPAIDMARTKNKADQALKFCKANHFNTRFCILIDMGLHSGVKRLVVWDFKTNSIQDRFLVSHGCCDNAWSQDNSKDGPRFSNKDGSHCSSLGKYRIGERGASAWGVGKKYLLHGLEASNSNALKRAIVLHSWNAVQDKEVYPNGTPEGWGCPAISDDSFRSIDPLLRNSEKPVLLWIYQ